MKSIDQDKKIAENFKKFDRWYPYFSAFNIVASIIVVGVAVFISISRSFTMGIIFSSLIMFFILLQADFYIQKKLYHIYITGAGIKNVGIRRAGRHIVKHYSLYFGIVLTMALLCISYYEYYRLVSHTRSPLVLVSLAFMGFLIPVMRLVKIFGWFRPLWVEGVQKPDNPVIS